jgi:hypothetical protein
MTEMNHTVAPCPFCGQKLRIPTDRGDLKLTCPKCRRKWRWFARPVETAKSNQHALAPALLFQESDEFYRQLSKMLRTEDAFTVQTHYTNYADLPARLKKIVKSARRGNISWSDWAPGAISALTMTSRALRIACFIIIGTTSLGAAAGLCIGALLGGDSAIPGALAGTLLGLLTGTVAAAVSQGSHQVEIEVDIYGRLVFRFNPVKAVRSA